MYRHFQSNLADLDGILMVLVGDAARAMHSSRLLWLEFGGCETPLKPEGHHPVVASMSMLHTACTDHPAKRRHRPPIPCAPQNTSHVTPVSYACVVSSCLKSARTCTACCSASMWSTESSRSGTSGRRTVGVDVRETRSVVVTSGTWGGAKYLSNCLASAVSPSLGLGRGVSGGGMEMHVGGGASG